MKIRELKAKSTEELKDIFTDMTQKRRELNFKLASEQLKNVREVRKVRKTIAQILTILDQRKKPSLLKCPKLFISKYAMANKCINKLVLIT